jgi:hypothetical protein
MVATAARVAEAGPVAMTVNPANPVNPADKRQQNR